MTNKPEQRMEEHAARPVPAIDAGFADRLESKLRVSHAASLVTTRDRLRGLLPRLGAIAGLVVLGVASFVGIRSVGTDDEAVPIAVVDEPPGIDATRGDDLGDPLPVAVPSATSTPTVTPVPPDPTVAPSPPAATAVPAAPTSVSTPAAVATPTVPPAMSVPTATPTTIPPPSTPAATSTPLPTPTPLPEIATPVPIPTATSTPAATPIPTATPSPTSTPTPTVESIMLEADCEVLAASGAVGVVCTWSAPDAVEGITSYEVVRSKNSGEREVVSRQRAGAERSFADRDVVAGDQVIYVIQALADDLVVAASTRQVVDVTMP